MSRMPAVRAILCNATQILPTYPTHAGWLPPLEDSFIIPMIWNLAGAISNPPSDAERGDEPISSAANGARFLAKIRHDDRGGAGAHRHVYPYCPGRLVT